MNGLAVQLWKMESALELNTANTNTSDKLDKFKKKIIYNSKTKLVHSNTAGSRSHTENTTKCSRLFTNVTKTDNG